MIEKRKIAVDRLTKKIQANFLSTKYRSFVIYSKAITTVQERFRRNMKSAYERAFKHDADLLFEGKKLRRRFSARLYALGDYLRVFNNKAFAKKRNSLKDQSAILFSFFCLKINRKFALEKRVLILTESNVHFCKYTLSPKAHSISDAVSKFKGVRSISLDDLSTALLSRLHDNFVAIGNEGYFTAFLCERKTELVSALVKRKQKAEEELNVAFSESIEIRVKCRRKQTFKFSAADGINQRFLSFLA